MLLAVGSENPVKIAAVKHAFSEVFPDQSITVRGIAVESGVSNQPMSDSESIKGATNRAKKALKALQPDFGIGLEGGVHKVGKYWFDTGWVVIIDKHQTLGIGSTVRIIVPDVMMTLIKNGEELGNVDDIFFKRSNSKHAEGHFGLMTNAAITRESSLKDAVFTALSRFLHPEFF